MEEKAYTPDEVAQLFQISKHTVYELIKRGELQAFKIGNKMRIEHAELERFKNNTKAPAKKIQQNQLGHPVIRPHQSDYLAVTIFSLNISRNKRQLP